MEPVSDRPFTPDWATPPGETIQDILKERRWTSHYLAKQLGISDKNMEKLLAGKLAIKPPLNTALSITLGSSPSFWLERERQYREDLHRISQQAKSYLTVCFCDWNYSTFHRGVMKIRNGKRTDEPIRRPLRITELEGQDYYVKPDPDFAVGVYGRCHRQLRVALKPGDLLFLRTLWRGKPYLIGYFKISEKIGTADPICRADLTNSRLINFQLEITPEILEVVKPDCRDKRHFNQQVVSALGRNYIKLDRKLSNYLLDLVNHYPNAIQGDKL